MSERRVKRFDELAQSVQPPRDLWPAIAEAIEADKAAAKAPAFASRRSFWRPTSAVAAAAALVAVGVLIGSNLGQRTVVPVATTTPGDPAVIPAALQRDAAFRKQRSELIAEVQVRLSSMPAAEREKVAGSLATLRRSIGEIEAALGRDPANALLQELLVSSCQEEMRALTAVRDAGSQET